jgi:hypothetical protein
MGAKLEESEIATRLVRWAWAKMNLEFQINVICDGKVTHLAREVVNTSGLSTTQKAMAPRIAKVAAELLAGEKVLTRSLDEHFKTAAD